VTKQALRVVKKGHRDSRAFKALEGYHGNSTPAILERAKIVQEFVLASWLSV
jgi:hypothetical protein